MKLVVQNSTLKGTVTIPGSKSQAIRALFFAHLAEGESKITNLPDSDDIKVAKRALTQLKNNEPEVDTGNSGITTRFILPLLSKDQKLVTGEQMSSRPIQPLVDALKTAPNIEVSGETSQFISSLLISLPIKNQDHTVTVKNLKERSYMDMTLKWLDELNIEYKHTKTANEDTFHIPGNQTYKPFEKEIPGDYSSASYFYAAPGQITLKGLDPNDPQPDKAMAQLIKTQPKTIDCNLFPDLLPTLAVLATQWENGTQLTNVAHARIKETDRIHSMATELKKMGAKIEETPDGLIIQKSKLKGTHVHGYHDHRTIMALAVAGLYATGTTIIDTAEGINKTFPSFVELMQSLGAKMYLKEEHIVLIGHKSVGKTTIGKKLAKALNLPFIDLDDEIGNPKEIVKTHGEPHFRDLETQALKKVIKSPKSVIALGGGTVLREENQNLIKNEKVVHLQLKEETIFKRIPKKFADPKRTKIYKSLANTDLCAIIGHPLKHTKTPEYYAKRGILMFAYECEEIPELPFHLTVVTMPHKQTIISHLKEIDPEAKTIGSVNTVINNKGYNTDLDGIAHALRNTEIRDKNVLLLGAGGAARTTAYFINREGGNLFIRNRNQEKAKSLAEEFNGKTSTPDHIDLIINATPLGMHPHENESPLEKSELKPYHTVLDMIYNPEETKLLKDASSIGAKTISGMEMFTAQAAKQISLLCET